MTTGLRRYEFSERLADILGESRRDLRFRVTLMISGGLVPPGPRGPGSPPATPQYAADLLIGVLAAPAQVHTVDAIACYRDLRPTVLAADAVTPGIVLGRPARRRRAEATLPPLPPDRPRFGEAIAHLLELARAGGRREALARELFGIWVSRSYPAAAVQLAAWSEGRRGIVSQRYELPEAGRPPAWLDPERGGAADPGLFHSVFLPVGKLIEIGKLTASPSPPPSPTAALPERKQTVIEIGQTIANLADLARQGRNRRPWETFLSSAAPAQDRAEKIDARVSRLVEVGAFGSNPGNLRMLAYVPDDLQPGAPLVVVLHGCTQTAASFDHGTGWTTLADRYGFAVLLPEQRRTNNPLRCFNWFKAEDNGRDAGEALSIRQMTDRMIDAHGLDRSRVFVTGLSAGAAMTSVMLATYPEVFAGGAIIAGVPYRCAGGLQDAFEMIFQGRVREASDWGDLVRSASPHQGPWPRVSVWHGLADSTVKPVNAEEIVKQWTDVHGLAPFASEQSMVDGHARAVWYGPDGGALVESFSIAGMTHGAAIDPSGVDGFGNAGPFILDMGISSTWHIARFWGIAETRRPQPATRPQAAASKPAVEADRPRPADVGGADSGSGKVIVVDTVGRARSDGERRSERAGAGQRGGNRAGDRVLPGGVDVQSILAKSFELAGLAAGLKEGGKSSGAVGGIDIQAILAKSFELAGVVKGADAEAREMRDVTPEKPAAPDTPAEAAPARDVEVQPESPPAPQPAPPADGAQPPQTAPEPAAEADSLAGTGWEGEGWQFLAGDPAAAGQGPLLFGHASSGLGGDVGGKVRAVTRTLALGRRPKLGYLRRLELNASANMLTTAGFTVLVDGVPVDEATAAGMDYAEAAWTERRDIDLAPFAGRTVTLTFEVAANSNVCIEVAAKAWVRGIRVYDDVMLSEV